LTATEDGGGVTGHLVATDVDAQKLTYSPTPGAILPPGISVDPDGTVHVDPSRPEYQNLAAGEHRDLQIPVQVSDERGTSVSSLLTVRVDGSNDAPVVTIRPPVPVDEGSGVHSTQVLATDIDATDTLAYGLPAGAPLPAGVTLDPATGQIGIDTSNPAYNHLAVGDVQKVVVPVVVSDGHGGATNTQVVFEVHGTNDAPVLAAIAQRTATEGDAPITGQLSATDPDTSDTLSYGLAPGISAPAGLTLQPDGHWAFDPKHPAYDHLRAGEQQQLVVPLQVSDGHGGTSQQTLSITVTGTNDGALISGTATGAVKEDGPQVVSGSLSIQDVDQGEAHFQAGDQVGSYGTLHIGADGAWSYTLNNNDPKVQGLAAGQQVTETLTVQSADGTQHQITIAVAGTNDATVISGVRSGSIIEDLGPQQATGVLSASDIDAGQTPTFVPQSIQGLYGSLDLQADGHWSYTADPQKIQSLKDGQQVVETFPVATTNAAGESAKASISVAIVGTDDKPVFPPLSLTAKEDGGVVTGHLSATDADAQKLLYAPAPGTHLPLGVVMGPDGTVQVHPSALPFQSLAAGEHRDLQIPVQVTDEKGVAVASLLTVRVEGTNDDPRVTVHPPVPVDEGSGVHSTQVVATDVDATDTLSYGLPAGAPLPAGVTLDAATGQIGIDTNNPAYNHLGVGDVQKVMVPVVVSDGHGGNTKTPVEFEVHGTNDAPVLAAIGQRTANEGDAPINGQLSATDPDTKDSLTYSLMGGVQAPAGFTLQPDGHWAFDPQNPAYDHLRAGEQQQVVIPLQVSDGHGGTSQQNLSITVTGTNDAPVIGGTSTGTVKEDTQPEARGQLWIADNDRGEAAFIAGDYPCGYGVLHVSANGSWSYTLDSNDPDIQKLSPDGYPIVVKTHVVSIDGTQHEISILIQGTDDQAVISGTTSGTVKEDFSSSVSGQLQVSDVDQENHPAFVGETLQGTFGQLVIDASGHWSYQLDNASAQILQGGTTARETFTVLARDSQGHQVSQQILVDVQGSADAARISGTATGAVSEDQQLTAGGKLDVVDPDRNEAHFQTSDQTGTYGTLHLGSDGTWQYTLNNNLPVVQQLKGGEQVSERFTVASADGTTHQISVQVSGRNDAAQISGTSSGQVTEDSQQQVRGQLNVSDVDSGEAHFQGGDQTGSYGTLHLGADGSWSYVLDNANPKVQALGAGASVSETFTVRSADGTSQQLSVRIAGTNDSAVITGTSTGQVTEDGQLTSQGRLQIQDV
ncbi:MAG: VCBS domain-containing protein, partial [Vulcanococcus sp.]